MDQCHYQVNAIALGGCGNQATIEQHIYLTDGACLPLNTTDPLLTHVFVYPNPFDTHLNLEWHGGFEEEISFVIFDILGKQVKTGTITEVVNHWTTVELYAGTYFLQLSNGKHRSGLMKIVKTLN